MKISAFLSGIAAVLAEHTGVTHSGCSQSGSIQPIPYVPQINGAFVTSAELYDQWKSSIPDICEHEPTAEENVRGKEELMIGDYLLIKWLFESASTFADVDSDIARPSGFLRADFPIYINLACKFSKCVEPATPYGSGEVLYPVELSLNDAAGVQPVLRYNNYLQPTSETSGIVLESPNPDFPLRPLGMTGQQYAITNLALKTTVNIPFNPQDKPGDVCLAVGTFVATIIPEVGSFQTRVQAFQDTGYIDAEGVPVSDGATLESIMVIDSESCSNVPPILETSLSGVSQILMAKPPPVSPPPPPLTPPPSFCPDDCKSKCAEYSKCITTGEGCDAFLPFNVPAGCGPESACAQFDKCYWPCTKGQFSNVYPPAITETCSPECSAYLITGDCLPEEKPCPPDCVSECAEYSKCVAEGKTGCPNEAKCGPTGDCSEFSECYWPCTKGIGGAKEGPGCSPKCVKYLVPCQPPPCPPKCFEMCRDYAACMSTLGVGCEALAKSPACYNEMSGECAPFYDCYYGCTDNKHKPKPSGSCSPECAAYLVPDCFPFTVSKDPHFQLPHGGRADFRGEDNTIFNLLSAKNMTMNVLIADADFAWNKRTVHGTKMSAAYWVVRTVKNKIVRIEYNTTSKGAAVYEEGAATPIMLVDEHEEFVRDNLHVHFIGKNKLRVKTDKWETAASKSPFPFPNLNRGKMLLDVEIVALYDADSDTVAPHGIFGQAYDGDKIAVDGAVDTERGTVTTTKAQAEGAIEGTWTDYKMESKFATQFKYTRFDATSAMHRDVSKLTGSKHAAGNSPAQGVSIAV